MKWVLIIVGVLLFLLGGVWVLQGLYVLTQGVMAGDMKWTVIGGILAAGRHRAGARRCPEEKSNSFRIVAFSVI